MREAKIYAGRVARWLAERHYGFLVDRQTGKEYFCHEIDCVTTPSQGDEVTFSIGIFNKREKATEVLITTKNQAKV